jgi:hypothetical protein
MFGSTITGVDPNGVQRWYERNTEGESEIRGGKSFDSGKSLIVGDMVCSRFQRNWWGMEYCSTIFRNPNGSPERKNEYVAVTDYGFTPFSPVR